MGKALRACSLIAVLAVTACTVHQTEAPPASGPSELGLSLRVTAAPDSISQDGASQSAIAVQAFGPNGQPKSAIPIRLDMSVNGVVQDFGTLSTRTVVTGSDGRASTVYTAPAAPPPSAGGSGTRMTILATPIGSDFAAAAPQTVDIRLVPPGVILPPAGSPTASFIFSPSQATANVPLRFDASASTPGSGATQISSYRWTFGDGGSASGVTTSHAFASLGTFTVTLTVTNDRGVSASTSQNVTVGASSITASFSLSPSAVTSGQPVVANATASRVEPGATIVDYAWNWGDSGEIFHTSSPTITHSYFLTTLIAAKFNVTLTITDSFGNQANAAQTIDVAVGGAQPAGPSFTIAPQPASVGQAVTFDATLSQPGAGGGTIVNYQWDFGDGSTKVGTSTPTVTHAYSAAGSYSVTLTVTTSVGNSGSLAKSVLVQ